METLQRLHNRGSISTGYDVDHSTAFDYTRTEYYHWTPSSDGNRRTWTYSAWIKRGRLGRNNYLWNHGTGDYNQYDRTLLKFNSDDALYFGGGSAYLLKTNGKFLDCAAWYHIVLACDTTSGTAGNRLKLYINGVQETDFHTNTAPDQNFDFAVNRAQKQTYFYNSTDSSDPHDGNASEVIMVDGQQLAPTEFGEFNDDGVWVPIDPSGITFGTNGIYMNFENGSDLGNDVSGNDNDLTKVNLDATDHSEDSPTNNFCTLDFNSGWLQDTPTGFTGGNLLRQGSGSSGNNGAAAIGTVGINPFESGIWYFEVETNSTANGSSSDVGYGWARQSLVNSSTHANNNFYSDNSTRYVSQTAHSGGDIQSVLLTCGTTPTIKFYRNDGLIHTATHGSNWTAQNEYYFPYVWVKGTSHEGIMNFGNPIQEGAVSSANSDPSGFGAFEFATKSGYALCSKNIAEQG